MAVYWTVYTILIFLKVSQVIISYLQWLAGKTLAKLKSPNRIKSQPRFAYPPRATFIFLASAITYTLSYFLGGFDVANMRNGLSFSIYSISFLPVAYELTILLQKFVKLGARSSLSRNAVNLPENVASELTRFNSVGRLLFGAQVVSVLISSIVFIVLSPILPKYELIFGQIGFAFKASFLAFAVRFELTSISLELIFVSLEHRNVVSTTTSDLFNQSVN